MNVISLSVISLTISLVQCYVIVSFLLHVKLLWSAVLDLYRETEERGESSSVVGDELTDCIDVTTNTNIFDFITVGRLAEAPEAVVFIDTDPVTYRKNV